MSDHLADGSWRLPRRDFLCAAGATAAGLVLRPAGMMASALAAPTTASAKGPATVRAAFLYPSTESLKQAGYFSWPGLGFDAEGRHRQYLQRIDAIAKKINVRVALDETPLSAPETVTRFINEVKQDKPDGLLLVAFKKSEWASVTRIIIETGIPTIATATLGVLLMGQIVEHARRPGVHVISSLDDFDAIEYGLRMVVTMRWMREAVLLSVTGTETKEAVVPKLGTKLRIVPVQRLADAYKSTEVNDQVRAIARAYLSGAKERREPSEDDVLEAARAYVACQRMLEQEGADAVMIECLKGIQDKQFPPPCMGFMSMRDEEIVAGCQNDLDATLSMMLVQRLFGKPGFQHNPACDTEKNLYFGAHCTCPSKLSGPAGKAEPYILRNHAEAGVGTVPQVIWPEGQVVTLAQYVTGDKASGPKMLVYTGTVVGCHDTPPAGGCRTNVILKINEVDAWDVKSSMHQMMFLGNHAQQLRSFCQMIDLPVTT